jgi:hypothetical protein
LKKYGPEADPNDWANVIAYYHAAAVVRLLAACGDELTRENLMYQATHMDHVHVLMLASPLIRARPITRRSSTRSCDASTAPAGPVSAASSTASGPAALARTLPTGSKRGRRTTGGHVMTMPASHPPRRHRGFQ